MTRKSIITIIGILALTSFAALGQNLLQNGSFEEKAGPYRYVPADSNELPGWTVILSGVEIITSTDIGVGIPWPANIPDGKQAVDLPPYTFFGGGGLKQSFGTTRGQSYDVVFYVGSIRDFGKDGTGTVTANVDGVTHDFPISTTSPDWAWFPRSFRFTATSSLSTLIFESFDNPFQHNASVDGIQVLWIPEPGTVSLVILGSLMIFSVALRGRQ